MWVASEEQKVFLNGCSELPSFPALPPDLAQACLSKWVQLHFGSRASPFSLVLQNQRRSFQCKNGSKFLAPSQASFCLNSCFSHPTAWRPVSCWHRPQKLWNNKQPWEPWELSILGFPAEDGLGHSCWGKEVSSTLCLMKGHLEATGAWCDTFCWARSHWHC